MLENALSSGILSMGVDVLFTARCHPGVAYVTRSLRADAGMVITASHNPMMTTGLKFFRADGYNSMTRLSIRLRAWVFSGELRISVPRRGGRQSRAH